ncbi:zinc finger FYVE domain-containing protein 26-like [Glandiceps talaboti]
MTHPFGKEEAVSAEQRFRFFCNNLRLGQWELARSCIKQCQSHQNEVSKTTIKDILNTAVECPYECSYGSASLPSPNHLSWLCLQDCEHYFGKDSLPRLLHRDVEFRLLLFSSCSMDISASVLKGLYNYHNHLLTYQDAGAGFVDVIPTLDSECLEALGRIVEKDPVLGYTIINYISLKGNEEHFENNQKLQQTYVDCIHKDLQALRNESLEDFSVSGIVRHMCDTLKLLDPAPNMRALQIRPLFREILRLLAEKPSIVQYCDVYSALMGRDTVYLIQQFFDVENEFRQEIVKHSDLSMSYVKDNIDISLQVSQHKNIENYWKDMFYRCLKSESHALENIVQTALQLIKEGLFEELTALLSPENLEPLKPLVLLLGWNYCTNCCTATQLLNALWIKQEVKTQPVLEQACNKLAYQVQLVQWCLQKAQPIVTASDSSSQHQRASHMFHGLENHSILYVLHKSLYLADLDEKLVLDILQERPVLPATHESKGDDGKEKKSVRFAPTEEEDKQLSIEQERDAIIYRSYCALKLVLDVMCFCKQGPSGYDNNSVAVQLESPTASKLNSVSRESCENDTKSETQIFTDIYNNQVRKKLQAVRQHLAQLYPLTYRVETLENIFSLLFVTHNDLKDSNSVQVENVSDSEEGHVDEYPRTRSSGESATSPMTPVLERSLEMSGEMSSEFVEVTVPDFAIQRMSNGREKKNGSFHSDSDKLKSDNISPRSSTSVCQEHKTGYIANRQVTGDVLNTLKDCLVDLSTAKYVQSETYKGEEVIETQTDLANHIKCSVPVNSLQQRLARLSQYINEAQWRYQLVSNTSNEHKEELTCPIDDTYDSYTEDDSLSYYGDSDGENRLSRRRRRMSSDLKSRSSSLRDSSGVESGSYTTGSQKSQEQPTSDASANNRDRRRRKKRRHRKRGSGRGLHKSSGGIISRLLASPNTLLRMCLRKANYPQARQVTKLLNIEDRAEVIEASFAQHFQIAMKKLQSLGPKKEKVSERSSIHHRTPLIKSDLGSIADVAAAGMASPSAMGIVDELLSTSELPIIINEDTRDASNAVVAKFATNSDIATLIKLDLACTASSSWHYCRDLLEVCTDQLQAESIEMGSRERMPSTGRQSTKKVVSEKEGKVLVGPKTIIQQIWNLLNASTYESSVPIRQTSLQKHFQRCLRNILTTGTYPITAATLQAHVNSCNEQALVIKKLQNVLKEYTEPESDVVIKTTGRPSSPEKARKSAAIAAVSQSVSRSVVRQTMSQLLETYDKNTHMVYGEVIMEKTDGDSGGTKADYLRSLYQHVDVLASLVLDSTNVMAGSSKVKSPNPFTVLEEGLTTMLGRMIFDQQIPPTRLESVAGQLKLNLVQTVVQMCCPSIPLTPGTSPRTQKAELDSCGRLVLNAMDGNVNDRRHPESIASDLLTRMLALMRVHALHTSGTPVFDIVAAVSMINTEEYKDIIHGTQAFAQVDLTQLQNRAEKICFYTNLLNMMLIHASLESISRYKKSKEEVFVPHHTRHSSITKQVEVKVDEDTLIPYTSSSTTLDHLTYMSKIAYNIAQLGTVSALDLRYIILRNGLLPPNVLDNVLNSRLYGLNESDVWNQFTPPPDPKLLFVINTGNRSSPPLKVLKPKELQGQLLDSMSSYLNANIKVNIEKQQVIIPELLHWFCNDFVTRDDSQDVDSSLLNEGVLNFVAPFTKAELRSKLESLMYSSAARQIEYEQSARLSRRSIFPGLQQQEEVRKPSPFQVKTSAFDYRYGYVLEESLELSPWNSPKRRHSSLPRDIPSPNGEALPPYTMTDTTIKYLKRKSNFVTPLVFMLSSVQQSTEEDEAGVEVGVEVADDDDEKDESGSTPLEKILNTVDKYSALQRYISTHVTALFTANEKDGQRKKRTLMENQKRDLGKCILSGMDTSKFQSLIRSSLNELVCSHRWQDAVKLIDSITFDDGKVTDVTVLVDFILCCASKVKGRPNDGDSDNRWKYLLRLTDRELYAHTVLAGLKQWSVGACIELLLEGLAHPPTNKSLVDALQKTLDDMRVYQKVLECSSQKYSESLHESNLFLTGDPHLTSETKWTFVAMEIKNNPDRVIDILVHCQEFNIARQWTQSHRVPANLKESIEEKYLAHVLSDHSNIMKAYQILEEYSDESACKAVCEAVLPSLSGNFPCTVFLSEYMLTRLSSQLSVEQMAELQCIHMGAKALLCLPEPVQQDYEELVSKPKLILEQLFMNIKVDLACKVLESLQSDISGPECLSLDCNEESLDSLILEYAGKALDFPVVQDQQLISELESTFIQSVVANPMCYEQPISIHSSSLTSSAAAPMTSSPTKSMTSSVAVPVSTSPTKSMTTSPPRQIRRTHDKGRSPTPSYTRPSSSYEGRMSPGGSHSKRSSTRTSPVGSATKKSSMDAFGQRSNEVKNLPLVPPRQADWVPDSAVTTCMVCKVERFSMFNRRHHCRRCGRVVCSTCSERTSIVPGYGDVPVRICDDCFDQFVTKKSYAISPEELEEKLQEKLTDGGLRRSSPKVLTPYLSSHGSAVTPVVPEEITELMEPQDWMSQQKPLKTWKLLTDDIYNATIRDEFYYEQAPSTSLCLSILDLHSNPLTCAQQILVLCRDVSGYLKPIKPGVPNPEVDSNLVISMIQTLLLNAKVRYMKCGESAGVSLCDTYLSRVDVLTMMLSSNYKNIPTIEELTKPESARRIRDKLLQDERLDLALEMCTKCGIDGTAVWAAWGMAHLTTGEYQQAREKFSRCLKVPSDRNQIQKQPPLLSDIISFLEERPETGTPKTEALLAPLSSIKDLINDPTKGFLIQNEIDKCSFDECIYYLQTYGNHLTVVEFYRKHKYLPQALQYIIEMHCSADVFMEGLLLPYIKKGDLSTLQEQMQQHDPSLEKWTLYLNATCRYLNRKSYSHVLYHFQIFMKDYIRAAMTCIKFFQTGAVSYADLFDRLHHLNNAKTHLKDVLNDKNLVMGHKAGAVGGRKPSLSEWSSPTSSTETTTGIRLVLSPSELTKHINTITLQIDVTKYLHRCQSGKGSGARQLSAPKKGLPTLFGNNKVKAEVVTLVLLSGSNISEGFTLAFRIIQDFRLPASLVYIHTGKQLAQLHKYKEIQQMLQCVRNTGLSDDQTCDDIISSCINIMVEEAGETKEVDNFIKMLKSDTSKINAYILCSKLKSAYLIAVQAERVDDVKRIATAAQRVGQTAVRNICERWLQSQEQKRQRELAQQELLLRATKQKP